MDPNENLKRQRELVKEIQEENAKQYEDQEILASCAVELAELVEAMDEWISKRGFLPNDWSQS
jgi:DNA-directed RNA polymerase specialized sigma subunit